MRLKSFGCSFIWGSDLPDENDLEPSRLSWPALLAQYLRREYQCYARPGAGNLQILEQVLNQAAESNTEDLFVIGWTWIDRFDYYSPEPTDANPWSTIMPVDTDSLATTYYRDLHSEYRDKLTSLIYVRQAVDVLRQKGIKFVMTYMDQLMFDQRWHTGPAVQDLQQHVQPCMTTFNGQTFLEWSRSQGFPESATWHPLTQAHESAAQLVITQLDHCLM